MFFSRKMTGWWFWLNINEYHKMNIGYLEELYSVNLCNNKLCSDQNVRLGNPMLSCPLPRCFRVGNLAQRPIGATPRRRSPRSGFGSRSGSQVAALYAWATECHGEAWKKPLGHGDDFHDFPDKNDKIPKKHLETCEDLAVLPSSLIIQREIWAPRPGAKVQLAWVLPGTLILGGFSGKHHQVPFSAFLIVVIHRL